MNKFTIAVFFVGLAAGISVWVFTSRKTSEDFELDKEKQQFIWDSEHITFEIESYFGKPFAKGLKEGDDQAIRQLAHADFKAQLVPTTSTTNRVATFSEEKWASEGTMTESDIEGLVNFFKNKLERFENIKRTKTRVLHIDAVEGDPYSWDTQLLFTAHGFSKTGQPIKISSHHRARFHYETDDEIRDGGTMMSWKVEDLTITESSKPFFGEATEKVGLDQIKLPDNWILPVQQVQEFHFQIAVEDFDLDGDFDIAIATFDGKPYLLCMEDGKFVNRSEEMGLKSWEATGENRNALAGWLDFDNDGYPDLVLGQHIYKNVGGLRFKDITAESGFDAGYEPHGMSVADYNCDGLLDIYVCYPRSYQQKLDKAGWVGDEVGGAPNKLWKNLGKGKFEDVTNAANAGGGDKTTFTSSWFFYDDDHFPDLYLANDFTKNVVLLNKGDGTFKDISDETVAADFATSMGVATGDLNNDGKTEIYVANMYSKMGRRIISHVSDEDYPEGVFSQIQGSCAGNRLYSIGDNGSYSDVTDVAGVNEVGWAFAPLIHDFDGDGLMDIYATSGFMSFSREKPDG